MDYDSPWKEAMEHYFEAFIGFFFPEIHKGTDWTRGYEFLDKELEKIVRDAETGRRIADKLVKVFLADGTETWLLIHIEIQGYIEELFDERMYIYNYRLFDRYRTDVVSLAVMTDPDEKYRPGLYVRKRWGCDLTFKFPVVKVSDYGKNWNALESNPNPFSIVVMAHLKARELGKGREEERKQWKIRLVRTLYERGYDRKDILELFRFIDWLLILPEDLEEQFTEEIIQLGEEKKMPYITSVERFGYKRGIQEGLQQGIQATQEAILEIIRSHFGRLSDDIHQMIGRIENFETLKSLLIKVIRCENEDVFRTLLLEATSQSVIH